ncbi:MAG: ribosomal L7Ae/L30e/S12e/Gadd45 family protein [archaeon]
MSLRDLVEADKKGNVVFGIKQVLKLARAKKLKKASRVFVARDTREETIKQLEDAGVEFEVLKNKVDITREMGIDFDSEVFLIN